MTVSDPTTLFRDRCHLRPEPWRAIAGPQPLPRSKVINEDREVVWARTRSVTERAVRADRLIQSVERGVAQFKQAYTSCDHDGMLSAAAALKKPVHSLRVELRVDHNGDSLPPRASQFASLGATRSDEALAWVSAIDQFLLGNGKKAGVPVAAWRRSFACHPLPRDARINEAHRASGMRQSPVYQRLDKRDVLVERMRAELENRDSHVYMRLDYGVVRPLRAAFLSIDQRGLPPHWLQYRYAGGFEVDNRSIWRSALVAWLDNYDCVPAYEMEARNGLPAYSPKAPATASKAAASTSAKHWPWRSRSGVRA